MVINDILATAKQLGFVPTDDQRHRDLILKGLEKKKGYCPCKIPKTQDNLCPCIELQTEGTCTCGLFVAQNYDD